MSAYSAEHEHAALAAALPFAAYGLVCLADRLPGRPVGFSLGLLGFYVFSLLGLCVGLAQEFPRWAYAYLAWAIVSAWGLSAFGRPALLGERLPAYAYTPWGWTAWIPLGATLASAVLLTRSWRPLRQIVLGLWHDWSLLSLGLYTLLSYAFVLYDENHSPFVLAFIAASTLAAAAGAWGYFQARRRLQGALGLAIAALGLLALDRLSGLTWDWRAYYHLPPATGGWVKAARDLGLLAVIQAAVMMLPAVLAQWWRAHLGRRTEEAT